MSGSPSSCVQRSRLCASAASTVQAPLALKWPEGKCASAWSLRSAMTCSTTAWSRCSASTTRDVLGAVGDEHEVPPVGPQLGLRADQAGAPDDQPPAAVGGLGDLRLARPRGSRCAARRPRRSPRRPSRTVLIIRTPIEYCQPAFSSRSNTFVFQNPESARSSLHAGRAGALDAGDQLLAEAQHPLLRVRRPLPQADVQRLARVGAGGEDRVVAEQPRVAVGGALLQAAADLADEAVDVDHQPPVAGPGAGLPRALKRLGRAARRAGARART